MQKWVEENQDSIEEFALRLGILAEGLFTFFSETLSFLVSIPGKVNEASNKITEAVLRARGASEAEVEASRNQLLDNFLKALTIMTAGWIAYITALVEGVKIVAAALGELWSRLFNHDNIAESQKKVDDLIAGFGSKVSGTFYKWFEDIGTGFGIIGGSASDAADGVEEWDAAAADAAEEAAKLAASIEEVEKAFEELKKDLAEKAEIRALKEMRQEIERALQESFRREDIERNFQEKILQIQIDAGDRSLANFEDWQEARTLAALNNSKKLIKIEEQYRDRLREIERDFELDASELARKRDAVGLLALERKKDRDLEKLEEYREKEKASLQSGYAEQLAELKAQYDAFEDELIISTQEQFDRAEEARIKEYEAMARSLDRQRQIRELHAQWQEEDDATALDKRLTAMGEHFATLEGMTATHLAALLEQYDAYNTSAVMTGFYAGGGSMGAGRGGPAVRSSGRTRGRPPARGRPARGGTAVTQSDVAPNQYIPATSQAAPPPNRYVPATSQAPTAGQLFAPGVAGMGQGDLIRLLEQAGMDPAMLDSLRIWSADLIRQFLQQNKGLYSNQLTGVYGQAGQVSTLLAGTMGGGAPELTNQLPARLPLAPASTSGTSRREIHVTADLAGVEAHTQRMVLNTMLEIERNRDG
jgi:hypothetical protein